MQPRLFPKNIVTVWARLENGSVGLKWGLDRSELETFLAGNRVDSDTIIFDETFAIELDRMERLGERCSKAHLITKLLEEALPAHLDGRIESIQIWGTNGRHLSIVYNTPVE